MSAICLKKKKTSEYEKYSMQHVIPTFIRYHFFCLYSFISLLVLEDGKHMGMKKMLLFFITIFFGNKQKLE